jgi:hypothetical protein
MIRINVSAIHPNCPRYIPAMQLIQPSIYIPRKDTPPVEPAWKISTPSRKSPAEALCRYLRSRVC